MICNKTFGYFSGIACYIAVRREDDTLQSSRIVPIVKDRAWLDEIQQGLLVTEGAALPQQV